MDLAVPVQAEMFFFELNYSASGPRVPYLPYRTLLAENGELKRPPVVEVSPLAAEMICLSLHSSRPLHHLFLLNKERKYILFDAS